MYTSGSQTVKHASQGKSGAARTMYFVITIKIHTCTFKYYKFDINIFMGGAIAFFLFLGWCK